METTPEIIVTEPYLALDRLNSWVRSREPWSCPARSTLRPIVYWVKNKAILAASKQWPIGLRRIMVNCKCRVCGGTGRWSDWHYHHWDNPDEVRDEPCRKCNSTGKVVLKFIESTIGQIRWHTPLERWMSCSLDVYVPFSAEGQWYLSEDWRPDQPGRMMDKTDVERDMLSVFREWPHEVAFHIGYQHRVPFEHQGRCTDRRAAEEWIRKLINPQTSEEKIMHQPQSINLVTPG